MNFPKEYKQDFSSETIEILFVWNYKTGGINCSTNVEVSFIQITLVSISFAYLANSNAANIQ